MWVIKSKNRLKTAITNLIIVTAYSVLFFYNLSYNSAGGSGLLWYFYLIFAIGLHCIVNLIGFILKIIRTK